MDCRIVNIYSWRAELTRAQVEKITQEFDTLKCIILIKEHRMVPVGVRSQQVPTRAMALLIFCSQ